MRILNILLILLILTPQVYAVRYPFYLSCNYRDYQIRKIDSMKGWATCGHRLWAEVPKNITVGEVYCYRPDYRNFPIPGGWYVCHRLKRIENGLYYFHGDNNGDFYDPPIEKKYIALRLYKN